MPNMISKGKEWTWNHKVKAWTGIRYKVQVGSRKKFDTPLGIGYH